MASGDCSILQVCCKCVAVVLQVWCSELQCVAMRCSALQCVAVCCSVLQCVAVCFSVLQCDAVCCSVMQGAAVCCIVLQCIALYCSEYCICASQPRMGMSHVSCGNEQCHTGMSHDSRMDKSYHPYESVMSHTKSSLVTGNNESCLTCE